jgi:cell wall-associated NlpC family hydrolase
VRRAATLVATVAVCAAVLPAAEAGAAPAAPASHPGLNAILAKASALSQQIDKLSEQYDGLKIQLAQARSEAAIAKENAKRDQQILGLDQSSIGAIAVENYMTGGINPALELLQASSPQSLLDRASIMTQIQHENGAKISLVATAEAAAQRAVAAAAQQQQRAKLLEAEMAAKVAVIQKKENFFNGKAYQQAEAIFQQTGKYPINPSQIPGDSVGVQALKAALTRIGYPYVWAAAGPTAFDCSGLVVWAYQQVGISLMHFTGDLWNEGEHVSRSELAPGDLVFFFADLGHVGIYIGNGLMVDAPTFGQNVQVQPVFWNAYVGAVRILG